MCCLSVGEPGVWRESVLMIIEKPCEWGSSPKWESRSKKIESSSEIEQSVQPFLDYLSFF